MRIGRWAVVPVLCLVLLAALVLAVMSAPGPPHLDLTIHRWMVDHRHGWVTAAAVTLTLLGSSPVLLSAFGVVAVATWLRSRATPGRDWLRPLIAFGVLVIGALLRTGLSDVLGRARPPRADWVRTASGASMPSGHSADSAMAAGLFLWLIWPTLRTRAARVGAAVTAGAFPLAVGWSRIYLGVHWPTDVLAGWLFAVCWVAVALLIVGQVVLRPPASVHPAN